MESDLSFRQYREKRERMYERLDVIRQEVTEWMDRHSSIWPELTDLARLEALHLERERLLADFHDTENTFIEYILKRRHD
jgi:hypothetical protein